MLWRCWLYLCMLRFVWIIQSLRNAVKVMLVPVCVAVWCGSPACRSRSRWLGCSTPAPWWPASDSGCACCSPAAWLPAPSPAACASCKADSFSSYSVPHNASCKADSFSSSLAPHTMPHARQIPSALTRCHTQCLMQGREAFSSSSVPHTMPHARQRVLQLSLSATHNASCKAESPSALTRCHTQCPMQGREAFSSSTVPHTMPHARQGGLQLFLSATHNASCKAESPSALTRCHTQCLMQGRESFSSYSVPHTMPHARQRVLQLLLGAAHNASFSSSSVPHIKPHARLIPLVFTIYYTHFFIMQGRFL